MQKTQLDTDTMSEVLKRKNRNVSRNAAAYRSMFGAYTVSIITILDGEGFSADQPAGPN